MIVARLSIVFEKLRFENVSSPHENKTSAFSIYFTLRSVFEKFRFHEGLVWTVGLTVDFPSITWTLP